MKYSDPPQYYADTQSPFVRSSKTELFLLTIEARPTPEVEDGGQYGGAFVNCWVDVDDLATAEQETLALILENGWQPFRFEAWSIVTRASYEDDPTAEDDLDYDEVISRAFTEGIVAVFNTWPIDAEDADEEM